ncbi:MAG: hypothetical protein JKY67_01150 [Pseudomonadales bacterium]|nr:hypothetical protein [Pseudomonadales bacterium]
MSDSRERPLKLSERMVLRVHISMCAGCRKFGPQLEVLHNAMQNFAKGENEIEQDSKDP